MLVVGITGGLATGKSLVTRRFHALGATTFSADEAARAVLTPSLLSEIAAAFGGAILTPSGELDRAALGRRIFADPTARERLEQLTHPPILNLLSAQIDACRADLPAAVVAVEVPLLFEKHLESWFERIVVVTASESVQKARLRARNGLDEAEADRRLAAQWPLALKAARAHHVLVNEGAVEDLYRAVDVLWSAWKAPTVLAAGPLTSL
jgi:dephospho-CoA kinase